MWFFRRAVLRKWRSKCGRNATYRNLAKCFYHADMSEMVEAICEVLGAPSGSVVGRQQGIYYIGILLIGIFLCTKGKMTWLPWILNFMVAIYISLVPGPSYLQFLIACSSYAKSVEVEKALE